MHANECPEPWPEVVREAMAQTLRGIEFNRYPDTSGRSLRAVLAERYGCDPGQVVLGNGSDEIISVLLTALSGGPDSGHLVIPAPTFVMYAHFAQVLGVEIEEVPLTDADLSLDDAAMRAALGRDGGAAICFLARPNNPTSGLWPAAQVVALVRDFPGTIFVVDEAYAAYEPGCSLWDSPLWTGGPPPNYVHMATLSKVGLAALRIGYCLAHPDLALALDKVRHPYNVSQTSIALAELILTRFADVQARLIATTIANRARLIASLERLPDAELFPAHANLVLVRFPSDAQARALWAALAEGGVLVKDLTRVPKLAGCLRISVGTSEDLDRLDAVLERVGTEPG